MAAPRADLRAEPRRGADRAALAAPDQARGRRPGRDAPVPADIRGRAARRSGPAPAPPAICALNPPVVHGRAPGAALARAAVRARAAPVARVSRSDRYRGLAVPDPRGQRPHALRRGVRARSDRHIGVRARRTARGHGLDRRDRKSTRLNSSHSQISYAVFCLKKKKKKEKKKYIKKYNKHQTNNY